MEYDIIERMAELAIANVRLEAKLKLASELLLNHLPFDQCSIYIWDGKKRQLILKAHEGESQGRVEAYGEGEGVPGLVKKKNFYVEAYKRQADADSWEGVHDRGLAGFRSAIAYPLKDETAFYGVLYLKAQKKTALTVKKRQTLSIAALEIAAVLKCAELIRNHQKAHNELKDIQLKLINAEKLMSLGDMAATLAHEIKNPLLSIGGFAARIKKHLGPDSPTLPYVDQMVCEIGRIEKIMNGIVRFLKDSAVELKPDDANEILEDALGLFEEDLEAHAINLIKDLHRGPLPVMADREQIKIAFDNLIANAIQSMEKGGTLTLVTLRAGDSVVMKVTDSGSGIDPQYLGYIFNPFFTTKEQGTGLGLPITHSIIMRHKGIIEVSNNVGAGATFTVKLPYAKSSLIKGPAVG